MMLITVTKPFSVVLFEVKFFYGRNALGKIFCETLFMQNLKFDGDGKRFGWFFAVFLRGVFYRRNVFPMTILGLKIKRAHGISVAAGDFQIINV
ncbi:MAG TPA: hypothetical protein VK253_08655 [Candidatus Binatia bacterium]|nr:hypothetical protein [Candidatus Binatia bacterium]